MHEIIRLLSTLLSIAFHSRCAIHGINVNDLHLINLCLIRNYAHTLAIWHLYCPFTYRKRGGESDWTWRPWCSPLYINSRKLLFSNFCFRILSFSHLGVAHWRGATCISLKLERYYVRVYIIISSKLYTSLVRRWHYHPIPWYPLS